MSSAPRNVLLVGDQCERAFALVEGTLESECPRLVAVIRSTSHDVSSHRIHAVIHILAEDSGDLARITSLRKAYPRALILIVVPRPRPRVVRDLLDHDIDGVIEGPLTPALIAEKCTRLLGLVATEDIEDVRQRLLAAHGLGQFIGRSPALLGEIEKIPEMSLSEAPVLIAGETGTGKELCARAIHYVGPRAAGPFIALNCGALPDHLIENEMFGHVKGAYTDAAAEQKGLVFEANGGTLFLDEVNTLSPAAQVKLLRFLDERRYKPLGSSRYIDADVRIVSAANLDLADAVKAGHFRKDLYYRINVLSLDLPPLRERVGDIELLAEHFLGHFARIYSRGSMYLTSSALAALRAHDWPGNVREIKAIIEKAVLLTRANVIRNEALQLPERPAQDSAQRQTFRQAKREAIHAFEGVYLRQLLRAHCNNVSQAAREAGKDRRSLQRLIRKHGLSLR